MNVFAYSSFSPAMPIFISVEVDTKEHVLQAFNINGNNFFRLRDMAYILIGTPAAFDIEWCAEYGFVNIIYGDYAPIGSELAIKYYDDYAQAHYSQTTIKYNGLFDIDFTRFNINNYHYFMMRDMADLLGFEAIWNIATGGIIIVFNHKEATDYGY
jgi:hypothetical protein